MSHAYIQAVMKMSDQKFEDKDYPTEWALNPSAYQNMNSDQVDWAALAQQWIKMKETVIPPAPPPPLILEGLHRTSSNDGGGEAPMDMDTKDDDIPPAPPAPNISGTDSWNQWNQWGGHWNQAAVPTAAGNWDWNNLSGTADEKSLGIPHISSNVIIPPPAPAISSMNSNFSNHCDTSSAAASLSPSFGYNAIPLTQTQFNNQIPSGGYWNNEPQPPHSALPGPSIPVQPSSFIKNIRPSSNRIPLVPPATSSLSGTDMMSSRNRDTRDKTPEDELLTSLDTIKRRQLPAWIREGLEKMEKEKQKAVERERQEILRKEQLEARKKIEDQARAVLNPSKSKFDSDSEKEVTEHEFEDDIKDSNNSNEDKQSQKDTLEQHSPDLIRPRKTRFHDVTSPVVQSQSTTLVYKEKSPTIEQSTPTVSLRQNKEEILQNLMLKVRRSLTEILLEVTNDEIASVCKEVWKRSCNKGGDLLRSSQNTAPLAQITRKLGLGIYGDSNSDSEEEHQSQPEYSQHRSSDENDSEEELKETLQRRQEAFRKTEAEIEAQLAQEEEDEREEDEDRMKSKRSGQAGGSRDEGTTRKKDGEDLVRDDQNLKEKKKSRGEGVGKVVESRLRKDNYVGNSSCTDTVDNEKDTVFGIEKKSSDNRSSVNRNLKTSGKSTLSSKSTVADTDRLGSCITQGDDSSSSESTGQCNLTKRTKRCNDSNKKSNKSYSSRKKTSRFFENSKDRSSSRSRSRSRTKNSSREVSSESSKSSKTDVIPTTADNTIGSGPGSGSGKNNRSLCKKYKNHSYKNTNKTNYKSKSRSTSRSECRFRSESKSKSRSRSSSRSRHKHSRSRSRSNSHRRRRSRNRQRSHSHRRTRTRSHSRSRSRSHSRSRSRSRKRSRSSYSHKSIIGGSGSGSGSTRKRETRSRSLERTRRSRSPTRSSRSYSYRHRPHYRRDRDGKKSSHRYQD